MGDDGVDGMLALRQAGATTIAQDEDSSLVYGMPREAARRGAASEVLPLQRIAGRLVELSRR
jgi:two-component system chemotaxis response regulator CheB